MKINTISLYLVFFFGFSVSSAICSRSQSVQPSYQSLKRKMEQAVTDLKTAQKRLSEVKFVSGNVHSFRLAVLSDDLASVRSGAQSVLSRLSDRSLKNLLRTFYACIDGTDALTPHERESYLALCKELEESLSAPARLRAEIQKISKEISPYIPPEVSRKMQRHASELVRVSRNRKRIQRELGSLEKKYAAELGLCDASSVRDRSELRRLAGMIVLNKKKLEFFEAAEQFSQCLKEAIADGKLLEAEKSDLTKAQSEYARLQAAVGSLSG